MGKVIVGTAQDITAAKQAEEALKRTNKELQQEVLFRKEAEQRASKEMEFNKSLTESSADGICAIDQTGTCITWNTTLEGFTTINRGQALGQKLTDMLPACGGEKLVKKVKNVLQGKSETISGISFRSKEKIFDAILVPVIDSQGEQSGGLCIFHDVSESNRNKEMSIAQKLAQQKELLHAVLKAQEAERKRIAEVLHNGLGQLLYATKLNLESLTVVAPGLTPHHILPPIKDVLRLMDEAISETRIISHDLMPTILEDFGLHIALAELCKKLTMSTLRFRLANFNQETSLDKNTEIAVYRMIQELLNNVIKHAKPLLLKLRLRSKEKSWMLWYRTMAKASAIRDPASPMELGYQV
jgi:PAS domain S-box-containing protein